MTTTWVQEAVRFFTGLEAHNERAWWQAHRETYDEVIKPCFLELIGGVGGFGPWRVHRPHNDVRFGTGKGPYKTFIGAVAERADGVGAFVQVSARGLLVGTGIPMPAPDQLLRQRAALADPSAGESLLDAVDTVTASGARVFGGRWEPLRRVPRGYPADHPRADLLRWKGLEIAHRPGRPAWLEHPGASSGLDALVSVGEPLHRWLGLHVGPSLLSAEERFAPRRRAAAGGPPAGTS